MAVGVLVGEMIGDITGVAFGWFLVLAVVYPMVLRPPGTYTRLW